MWPFLAIFPESCLWDVSTRHVPDAFRFQNQMVSAAGLPQPTSAVTWEKDGSCNNWSLKSNGDYRSDDVSDC